MKQTDYSDKILSPEQFLNSYRGGGLSLVIGGTGFIGSHVADVLHEKGDTAVITRSNLRNIKHNLGKEGFYPIHIDDLMDPSKKVDEIVEKSNVIYHLAGYVAAQEAQDSMDEAASLFSVNALLTAYVTSLAKKHGKRIVYVSAGRPYASCKEVTEQTEIPLSTETSELFGSATTLFNEYCGSFSTGEIPDEFIESFLRNQGLNEGNLNTLFDPLGLYSTSKLLGGQFVTDYDRGVVVRTTHVLGGRYSRDLQIAKVVKAINSGEDVTISSKTQNFVRVNDVANAIVKAGEIESSDKVFILASPTRYSPKQLEGAIVSCFGGKQIKSKITVDSSTEPPKFKTSYTNDVLGFIPLGTEDTTEAITDTVKWLLKNMG